MLLFEIIRKLLFVILSSPPKCILYKKFYILDCLKLVYYEQFQMIGDAIARQKQLKGGSRSAKVKLVESMNPLWKDLFEEI